MNAAPGIPLLRPVFAQPVPGVGAAMSTRQGGHSRDRWSSLNLGAACGDHAADVAANRAAFAQALAARPVWLRQVHGVDVLLLDGDSARTEQPPADACWTRTPGIACTVVVADCLPVLFAARDGRAVAAAHAGWRGLAAGVLQATLAALEDGAGLPAKDVLCWLGPCIGPAAFEVGADVLRAFGADSSAQQAPEGRHFRPRLPAAAHRLAHPQDGPRWLADLEALARDRLIAAGVPAAAITGGGACTYGSASDFFSFRRDGVTGRMAAAIWRRR